MMFMFNNRGCTQIICRMVPPAAGGIQFVALAPAALPPSASPSVHPHLLSDWIPLGVIDSDTKIRKITGAHCKTNENKFV